jgi:hypothetical protein
MSSIEQNPAWRRESPRDDSPDERSEIFLDDTPVPAWKTKPKAWLKRTNVITALIVIILSIFFLVAALHRPSPHVEKSTFFILFLHPIQQVRPSINLTCMHRSQHDDIKTTVLPRAQVPTGDDPLWTLHRTGDERRQRHEGIQPNGRSEAMHRLSGYLDAGRTDVRGWK